GLRGGYVAPHHLFTSVKRNASGSGAHVSIVGVGHLTRPVHNTSHNPDLNPFQVIGAFAYHRGRLLQVEQRSSAGRTGNVFRLGHPVARGLQDAEGCAVAAVDPAGRDAFSFGNIHTQHDAVAKAVDIESADVGTSGEHERIFVGDGVVAANVDRYVDIVLEKVEEQTPYRSHGMCIACRYHKRGCRVVTQHLFERLVPVICLQVHQVEHRIL